MKKITLVVVDDHKLVREMWKHILSSNEKLQVVGESGQVAKAVDIISNRKPDLVLLDINLPPDTGFDAMPLIRKASPKTKIIALSMHAEPVFAKKMLQLGARGYVTKNSPLHEVYTAIEEVL